MAPNDAQASSYELQPHNSLNGDDLEKDADPQGRSLLPRKRPLRLKGWKHIFAPYTVLRWKAPHAFRKAGLAYRKLNKYRHRDVFSREWTGDYEDRYISAGRGKISRLVVQATDEIYENNVTSTYRRTFIRNISPFYMRLANWPFNHIDYSRTGKATREDYPMLCLKWFIASCIIPFVISSPTGKAEGTPRNGGAYDEVPYHFWGYAKVAKNAHELDTSLAAHGIAHTNPIAERVLRPRYLCFLREPGQPAMVMHVEDWIAQYAGEDRLSYVFIAYTAEQFQSAEDLRALHQIADAAARDAGVVAYWIGCSCMPDPAQLTQDVYRICDIIRGAHALAIAVGRPTHGADAINTTTLMLQQWGQRIWTFPELLLAPAGKPIAVYTRGASLSSPLSIPKNQFAARVWTADAHIARQLVDHYEGTLILSQLELVTLALECLHARQTTQYLPGDASYALMGLLRVRPEIDASDSPFQAFARLSLANGSDRLLERLVCVLPTDPAQPWHAMDDAWGAKLWDILPQDVSIAGVGESDTIIVDGCRAASVRWKAFAPVAYTRRASWKRWVAQTMLRLGGVTLLVASILVAMPAPTMRNSGIVLLVYSVILMALSPWLLRVVYMGKFWQQQCGLFGFEGYLDIATIEAQIFGGRLGRMKWTVAASPLSRHHRNEYGECVPDDPTSDPAVKQIVERAKSAAPGDQRVFTLVDTGNMTATLFLAERPPTCLLMSGSEGGMKRVIGCSYDWTTSTFYRETVLRMETRFEDSMKRISRVKIGFKRAQHPYGAMAGVGEPKGQRIV